MARHAKQWYAETVNEHEKLFHTLLGALAGQCKAELNEFIIEMYDQYLSPHGYENVCKALKTIFISRGSNDAFPSIDTILRTMGVNVIPKSLAVDITNKICGAITSKGYNWADKVPDLEADMHRVLGDIGVLVVKRIGGWATLIELANGNPTHYRSWIRDSAIAILETQKGTLQLTTVEAKKIEHVK